ncbi:rhomboid family intramembrane serine protease [Polyangium jinanense]|uniref:Rhomboid family intramembrane serine protease n=1 Tax=Polyangium jinanense TaxID=2829994 RepID=A0A9X3WY06_9BACT|nr:rhomboid family intramembrane serine protease [Polyangium jinanense]MDC3952549.1 rhomboid family intramembrane serine protease [Polyangium jinanense]MDC3980177.1 rhomboid family intramembrane serine protease [Polyangium jinanense]
MMPEERIEEVELATDPNVVRRDRLLGAIFAEDPESCLVQHGVVASHVVTTSAPPQILLLPTRDRDALDKLPKLLAQIVASTQQAPVPMHVVAVGGGPEIVNALRRASSSDAAATKIGFHHVDDASRFAHVNGPKLALLERAAERIRTTEPPSPERIEEALVKGRNLAQRDRRAVSRLRGGTPVTIGIIAICAVLGVLTLIWKQSMGTTQALVSLGATSGPAVKSGEVWRIFASAFLHASVMHFVMNMVALWSLGLMLEPILGSRRFLVLYGLSGLGGALATTLLGSGQWSVGASGAIWGLMTAVLAIVLFPRGILPPLFITRLKQGAWRPLVPNVLISFFPGVDYLAHFGGGILGFVVTALFLGRGLKPVEERIDEGDVEPGPRPLLSLAATLVGAVMLVSIGAGVALGGPWTMKKPPAMTRTTLPDLGLSVEMPAPLAKKPAKEVREGMPVLTFGDIDASPVFVEILVVDLEQAPPAEELDAFVEEMRAAADEAAPAKATRLDKARIETVGTRKVVHVEHELSIGGESFSLRTYFVIVGSRELIVRGYARKGGRPEGWKGIEEKVVASIEER